ISLFDDLGTFDEPMWLRQLARAYRKYGGGDQAAAIMTGLLERAIGSEEMYFDPEDALLALIDLERLRRFESADALRGKFIDWLSSTQSEATALGDAAYVWLVARELAATRDSLPALLYEGIAETVLGDETNSITWAARHLAPQEALDVLQMLQRDAPGLAQLVAEPLRIAGNRVETTRFQQVFGLPGTRPPWQVVVAIILLVMGLLLWENNKDNTPGALSAFEKSINEVEVTSN
ncbi:hypothetical protein JYT22_00845, partial [Endomicrobium sp. AH-315-J14]|nr:hypothetical protein [Endomicrobium sp. AH-315-J14]